jgi:hypothetical protein
MLGEHLPARLTRQLTLYLSLSGNADLTAKLMQKGVEPSMELIRIICRTGVTAPLAIFNALRCATCVFFARVSGFS